MVGTKESASPENVQLIDGGKKDPYLRRKELLVENGLAEVSLILSLLSLSIYVAAFISILFYCSSMFIKEMHVGMHTHLHIYLKVV